MITVRAVMPVYDIRIVPDEVEACLRKLDTMSDLKVHTMIVSGAPYLDWKRNAGAADLEFDYYLALDSDIVFKPDDLRALLRRDKDIVGAAYRCRHIDRYVGGHFAPEYPGHAVMERDWVKTDTRNLTKVQWIGMGMCLIKRRVFMAMSRPYFSRPAVVGPDFELVHIGEDLAFCMKAARHGFDIYMDASIEVEHLPQERRVRGV